MRDEAHHVDSQQPGQQKSPMPPVGWVGRDASELEARAGVCVDGWTAKD